MQDIQELDNSGTFSSTEYYRVKCGRPHRRRKIKLSKNEINSPHFSLSFSMNYYSNARIANMPTHVDNLKLIPFTQLPLCIPSSSSFDKWKNKYRPSSRIAMDPYFWGNPIIPYWHLGGEFTRNTKERTTLNYSLLQVSSTLTHTHYLVGDSSM